VVKAAKSSRLVLVATESGGLYATLYMKQYGQTAAKSPKDRMYPPWKRVRQSSG
jgi:hypothetical protein